ncbi:MAG: transposon-transfer assisting family protein [Oscillospiraceae bacterium]|nr:transposon-transfer assisting family protein [Oscillospiraceae bacterium]MBR0196118.1 transposon-transfer assisting family protein [Paludibacteraceae bacterium]
MKNFTHDEINLTAIYDTGSREGTIKSLADMRGYLEQDEQELRTLTDSTISKLEAISDADYEALDLYPEFGEDEASDNGS